MIALAAVAIAAQDSDGGETAPATTTDATTSTAVLATVPTTQPFPAVKRSRPVGPAAPVERAAPVEPSGPVEPAAPGEKFREIHSAEEPDHEHQTKSVDREVVTEEGETNDVLEHGARL